MNVYGSLDLRLGDCIEGMKAFPDGRFDLAIVDPPYGIGEDGKSNHSRRSLAKPTLYTPKNWDSKPPDASYFKELRRVSKHQIIWGANHFIDRMPWASPCWIVWDKDNTGDFADCELAWGSFNSAVRKFKFRWNGMLQEDMSNKEKRIHPTQKPVSLYKWLLLNYAKTGQHILDTHLGSGSHAIAAHYAGVHLTAFEIDPDYFYAAKDRITRETAQRDLFLDQPPEAAALQLELL